MENTNKKVKKQRSGTGKPIPIILSADNNYHLQMVVTLMSVIENKKESTSYSFHLLITDDFDKECIKAINRMLKDHRLKEADFIRMGSSFKGIYVGVEHLSTAAYYRLSLPELLKDEDRCIYLDVDTIVLDDLSELFSLLKDDELLTGVKAASYYWPVENQKNRCEFLMIDQFDSYINTGVMVMNLALMREMNMSARYEKTLKAKNWETADQDVLNSACHGYIGILPPKYNSMTKYHNENADAYDSAAFPCLKLVFTRQEWEEACRNPVVIHYVDWEKPWNSLSVSYAALWWKYLKLVDPYYPGLEDAFVKLADSEMKNAHREDPVYIATLSELESIKNSLSFRIGRMITFPLRKIRELFR